VQYTVPVKAITGTGRIVSSYRKMRANNTAELQAKVCTLSMPLCRQPANTVKSQPRSKDRGHVKKTRRLRQTHQAHKIHEVEAERKRIWNAAEERAIAYQRGAPARATLRLEANHFRERTELVSKTPVAASTVLESKPDGDYMEEVRALHPASDDLEECRKRRNTMLESILGSERMHVGVGLPSGHSRISNDLVLASYNHERFVNHKLSLHQEYQAIQRQQWEEMQRKVAEKEAERQRKAVLLDYYWSEYVECAARLTQLGPVFHSEITHLLQAMNEGNLDALRQAANALINDVLEPADSIFEDMMKYIMLETMGAQSLRETWPLDDVDRVLAFLDAQTLSQFTDDFQGTLGYMLQGLRAICEPILAAVPFENPLNEQPAPIFEAKPIPGTFEDFAKQNSQPVQQPLQLPQQLQQTQQETVHRTNCFLLFLSQPPNPSINEIH
jgi:hypothetical protein